LCAFDKDAKPICFRNHYMGNFANHLLLSF